MTQPDTKALEQRLIDAERLIAAQREHIADLRSTVHLLLDAKKKEQNHGRR
jgi:hypothetical protein